MRRTRAPRMDLFAKHYHKLLKYIKKYKQYLFRSFSLCVQRSLCVFTENAKKARQYITLQSTHDDAFLDCHKSHAPEFLGERHILRDPGPLKVGPVGALRSLPACLGGLLSPF